MINDSQVGNYLVPSDVLANTPLPRVHCAWMCVCACVCIRTVTTVHLHTMLLPPTNMLQSVTFSPCISLCLRMHTGL